MLRACCRRGGVQLGAGIMGKADSPPHFMDEESAQHEVASFLDLGHRKGEGE